MNIKRSLSYTGGVIVILLILVSITLVLLPVAVKWEINSWFEDQGLISHIDELETSLTEGQFIIQGLTVNNAEGKKVLGIGNLLIQMGIRDLWSKVVSIEKIHISDVYIDAEQDAQGLIKVAGIRAGSQPSHEVDTDKENVARAVSEEETPWSFSLAEISLSNIEFCYRAPQKASLRAIHDCASFETFEWNGNASYVLYSNSDRALSELTAAFHSSLTGFSVNDVQLKRTLMRSDQLQINDVGINGINKITIGKVLLDNYSSFQVSDAGDLQEQEKYLFSSARLALDDLQVNDLSVVEIKTARVEGLKSSILVKSDGSLETQSVLKDFFPEETTTTAKDEAIDAKDSKPGEPFVLRLGELVIAGDSSIDVRDESVKPVFSNKLGNIQLIVKDVDMSDAQKETQVSMSLVVGEHGEVKSEGKIQLLSEKPTLSMNVKVVGINIGDFDAYAKQLIQHKVKSGHLDGKFDIKINRGVLDTKANVKLHKFYVETLGEKESSQYKEKLGIPLGTALSLLREKDDSISIKMPITGDVENPDFSLSDIIRKVSALAIKEAVINYYTPFGLVKLLAKGFDLATALRFEPVLFDAGRADLDQKDKKQLDKLAELLNERPGLHLVVCGHATQQDFNSIYPEESKKLRKLLEQKKKDNMSAEDSVNGIEEKVDIPVLKEQQEKMDSLAVSRGKAVTQYLVEQYKIGNDRLILCNPEFKYEEQGKMRTEISI